MPIDNPFLDFLEQEPRAAFYSYLYGPGNAPSFAPRQQRFFQDQFTDIHNMYLGYLGRQVREGMMPQGSATDFFGGFDFPGYYRRQVPYEGRNAGYSGFVPRTRWL